MDAIKDIIPETKKSTVECDLHGVVNVFKTKVGDKWMGGKCGKCVTENDAKEAEKTFSYDSRLPKRFKRCTFDNYHVEEIKEQQLAYAMCDKYATTFKSNKGKGRIDVGGCLIMFGSCGTGKTHLASAMINKITANGNSALYAKVYDVVGDVKATWSNNGMTESEAMNVYTKPDLLVIDEVGMQFGSESEELILFRILNRRYEDVKCTVIVSNLDDKGLTKYLGERLIDRLHESGGAEIGFNWGSHRRNK